MAHLITGNKFNPDSDIPDLTGKVYVVTGGSAGIGLGITAHLLQHHASKIYLLSNKEEHAAEAIEALKDYGDTSNITWKKCNLEDLHEVDSVAKELAQLDKIDALVCNAGLGVGVFNLTKDGIDSHMQVNHISQVHLTMTLLPVLQKTENSRIVFQSSDLHRAASSSTKFESLDELNQDIGPTLLYNRTKLAQVLFVKALVDRKSQGSLGFSQTNEWPWINATHPGGVSTDQQEQAIEAYGTLGKIGVMAVRPFMKDPISQGCRPILFAATSQDIIKDKVQGAYIVPDRKVTDPSSQAQDKELGERLWRLTEQILTDKLGKLQYA